jgi:hypothetical protein
LGWDRLDGRQVERWKEATLIRFSLAQRTVVLVASLLAVSASGPRSADESIHADDFDSGRLYLWSDAVGLAAGEVCYRPDAPEVEWTEWSGTCAPSLLCCACGLFPCEFRCFDGPQCPIDP